MSDLESGQAPFLTPLTKIMLRLTIVHQFHDKEFHSSVSTCEEFLQYIIFENIPIHEEEAIHLTRRAMRIYGSIKSKIVLANPFLVTTNELYFSKSTWRTEANFLADKFIFPKNLRGTPGMHQYYKKLSGAAKALYLMFRARKNFFPTVRLVNPAPHTWQNIRLFKRNLLQTCLSVRS